MFTHDVSDEQYIQLSHKMAPDLGRMSRYVPAILSYATSFYLCSVLVDHCLPGRWFGSNEYRRFRVRNLIVTLLHALIASAWAGWEFVTDPGMRDNWFYHESDSIRTLLLVSIGYFTHDAVDLIRHESSRRSLELLLHHAAIVFGFTSILAAHKFTAFCASALLMEVNSIFLHLRMICILLHVDAPVVRALNLITIVPFRFFVQFAQWYFIGTEVLGKVHTYFHLLGICGSLLFLIVNSLLFYRVLKADGWLSSWHTVYAKPHPDDTEEKTT